MRLIGTLLDLADKVRKDPTILFSYSKLFNKLKNGSTISDNRTDSSSLPSVDSAGTNSPKDDK